MEVCQWTLVLLIWDDLCWSGFMVLVLVVTVKCWGAVCPLWADAPLWKSWKCSVTHQVSTLLLLSPHAVHVAPLHQCDHTAPCAIMSYQGLLYSTCWNICTVVTHGHELQSNSQLYTWIGTWKVHSISDTLEVYCYLQCKPTTFSTWEMPFFITWMHPYLSILIWVAAYSDLRIRKCYFNWKDLQTRDHFWGTHTRQPIYWKMRCYLNKV